MATSSIDQETKATFSDTYKRAADTASETISKVMDSAKNEYDAKKSEAELLVAKAASGVAERPLVSVCCAFAAGWLVSKILK